MQRAQTTLLAGAGLLLLIGGIAGCGIAGTWRVIRLDGQFATGTPQYAAFTLDPNGAYAATIDLPEGIIAQQGTYVFDEHAERLTLRPAAAAPVEFGAELGGNRLELVQKHDGAAWTGTYARQ